MKPGVRGLLLLLLLAGGAVGVLGVGVQRWARTPIQPEGEALVVQIPKGASARKVSELLEEKKIIAHPVLFERYLRWKGAASGIRAGEFQFRTDHSPQQVMEILLHGAEVTWPLTLPEGLNMKEMAQRLETQGMGKADTFLALCRDPVVLKEEGIPLPSLEGFLYPETYRFRRGTGERQMIAAMVAEFRKHWTAVEEDRARQLGMTREQVVTLASVVEKETGAGEERPLVASVFHNRLKRGMKLESDPTIIYGLTDYHGDIRYQDIRNPHPWNTYVIPGLPQTPIASPGARALQATLHPAETEFLYFVAQGGGRHHFSATYEEHARMVQRYQMTRKPLPGASP